MGTYNWNNISRYNEEEFREWFLPRKKTFKYKKWSGELARKCNKYFHIWWDPERVERPRWNRMLSIHCYKYFLEWWNSDKFNWHYLNYLCRFCSQYFEIWWDPDKFDWYYLNWLYDYCQEYRHIWEKDYLIWKL